MSSEQSPNETKKNTFGVRWKFWRVVVQTMASASESASLESLITPKQVKPVQRHLDLQQSRLCALAAGKIWPYFIPRGVHDDYSTKFQEQQDLPLQEKEKYKIGKDVHRTYSLFTSTSSPYQKKLLTEGAMDHYSKLLSEVLCTTSHTFPYCQGMNFLVAQFLLTDESTSSAFALFHFLLTHRHLTYFFDSKCSCLLEYLRFFEKKLRIYCKPLYKRFKSIGFGAVCYAVEWFTTCFIVNDPGEFSLYVLDLMFAGISDILLRLGLAIMIRIGPAIMALRDDEIPLQFKDIVLKLKPIDVIPLALLIHFGIDISILDIMARNIKLMNPEEEKVEVLHRFPITMRTTSAAAIPVHHVKKVHEPQRTLSSSSTVVESSDYVNQSSSISPADRLSSLSPSKNIASLRTSFALDFYSNRLSVTSSTACASPQQTLLPPPPTAIGKSIDTKQKTNCRRRPRRPKVVHSMQRNQFRDFIFHIDKLQEIALENDLRTQTKSPRHHSPDVDAFVFVNTHFLGSYGCHWDPVGHRPSFLQNGQIDTSLIHRNEREGKEVTSGIDKEGTANVDATTSNTSTQKGVGRIFGNLLAWGHHQNHHEERVVGESSSAPKSRSPMSPRMQREEEMERILFRCLPRYHRDLKLFYERRDSLNKRLLYTFIKSPQSTNIRHGIYIPGSSARSFRYQYRNQHQLRGSIAMKRNTIDVVKQQKEDKEEFRRKNEVIVTEKPMVTAALVSSTLSSVTNAAAAAVASGNKNSHKSSSSLWNSLGKFLTISTGAGGSAATQNLRLGRFDDDVQQQQQQLQQQQKQKQQQERFAVASSFSSSGQVTDFNSRKNRGYIAVYSPGGIIINSDGSDAGYRGSIEDQDEDDNNVIGIRRIDQCANRDMNDEIKETDDDEGDPFLIQTQASDMEFVVKHEIDVLSDLVQDKIRPHKSIMKDSSKKTVSTASHLRSTTRHQRKRRRSQLRLYSSQKERQQQPLWGVDGASARDTYTTEGTVTATSIVVQKSVCKRYSIDTTSPHLFQRVFL